MIAEILAPALELALSPAVILAVLAGVVLGVTVGAVPGISGDMAMALLLPFVFTMDPAPAIGMLMGVYKGGLFGGSVSAILFGVPGTPGAAATIMDGYPAKLAGYPNRALHTALYSSVTGDFIGLLVLVFVAAPLAMLALHFGPREFFALYLVSILIIAALDGERKARGMAAACFGVLLAMVGRDPFTGAERLTFGIAGLGGGLSLVPVLIGLFAVSEILLQASRTWHERRNERLRNPPVRPEAGIRQSATDSLGGREFCSLWRPVGIGSALGTFIGALPGAGATLAGFLSYGLARRASGSPERFGQGSLEGIAAPEAGNSATANATLIPLFAFGIPGSGSAALIGAAFVMQGISPGPMMIDENLAIVYAIFLLLFAGSLFNLLSSKLLLPWYARIAMFEPRFMLPIVLALAVLGTYAANNTAFDVLVLVAAGLTGVALRLVGIPVVPLALGFILGPGLERALRQSLILGQNELNYLLGSSTAVAIYVAGAALLLLLLRSHAPGPAAARGPGIGVIVPSLFTAAWGIAFFHAVLKLGLIAGTFLGLAAAMAVLSGFGKSRWPAILLTAAGASILLWIAFGRFAPIVIP